MCALVAVVALALTAVLVVSSTSRSAAAPPVVTPSSVVPQDEDTPMTGSETEASSAPVYASPSSATPLSPTALVSVSSAAASSPDAATVQALLDRHFGAINAGDYGAWVSTVTADRAAQVSSTSFRQDYATTIDSTVVVSSIEPTGEDSASVAVSFTSNQAVASAPADLPATCIRWTSTWPVSSLASGGAIATPAKGSTSKTAC